VDQYPKRADGLEIFPADEGYVVYEVENERVHYLNPVAALIYELCNGENSTGTIVELVQQSFTLVDAPAAEVTKALEQMQGEGLIK
jgi:hypothetical protein